MNVKDDFTYDVKREQRMFFLIAKSFNCVLIK